MISFLTAASFSSESVWYAGKPESEQNKKYQSLYEYYFDHVQDTLGMDPRKDPLTRSRIVNLVNKATGHWEKHQLGKYQCELRYLFLKSGQPKHYQFILTQEKIIACQHNQGVNSPSLLSTAQATDAAAADRPSAPKWKLTDLEGNPVSSSDFKGDVALIDF